MAGSRAALRMAMLVMAVFALASGARAATTDEAPAAIAYPRGVNHHYRAPQDPLPEVAAREAAAADAAAAACNEGSAAGCVALGDAFQRGEGRPQIRPVAELLYRRACNAADGAGCAQLAALLLHRGTPQDEVEAEWLTARACRLGVPADCTLTPPDPREVEAGLRADCRTSQGTAEACRTLAAMLLAEPRTRRRLAEGLALIDRQCRAGGREACADALQYWEATENGEGPRTLAYRDLACTAGDTSTCIVLAKAAFARGPDGRAAATALFARACAGGDLPACTQAADLAREPLLAPECDGGTLASCTELGLMLYRWNSVLFDPDRAIAVLSAACEAGAFAACKPAGEYTLNRSSDADRDVKARRAVALLARGCEAGEREACETLADELAEGPRVLFDQARAEELYLVQCDAGRAKACDALVRFSHPAAPAPLAQGYDPPIRTPEEIAEEKRIEREERERQDAELAAQRCQTNTAIFEGVTYSDTLCVYIIRVIGGVEVLNMEQAPWQALLWRPEQIGRTKVSGGDRVLCGGSLVRTGWIVTAAHCLVDIENTDIVTGGHRVRLGLIRPFEDEGNSYAIRRAIRHPRFDPKTYAFDIALVEYDPRSGTRGDFVTGVARINLDRRTLAQRPVRAGAPVFTFGFGRTRFVDRHRSDFAQAAAGSIPTYLQAARLMLRDAEECTQLTAFRDLRRDSILCAAGANGEQACDGDSGGPLVTYGDQKGVPTLIGVVSAGKACGTTGKPSRYVRIGHPLVQAWLEENLPGFRAEPTAR